METEDLWVSYREAFGRYGAIRGFYMNRLTGQMTEQQPGDERSSDQDGVLVRPRQDGVFQFRMSSVQGVLTIRSSELHLRKNENGYIELRVLMQQMRSAGCLTLGGEFYLFVAQEVDTLDYRLRLIARVLIQLQRMPIGTEIIEQWCQQATQEGYQLKKYA
ncbi:MULTISPECIES: hypothetical protein [Exiguobacterium]|uniref:PilZ domain-containing protein n=1 Tax=Exiguobacterium antarcticum TaxID=132920 RepID=A0ABT6R3N6_9BACL|nr:MULTISPECIES: hypothetical protein [Exiguobacterium]AFS69507.1 hypothetical protein Eab7_0346 [Exiguobacterium antarcticum B7]MCT4781450.1 hypothetical protein [Exiguobacterium soli]MDI3235413.1 hypothetical protein [Exiguobacterium antarcticum]